jgi:6-phospho-beta-glucosidase
MELTGVDAAISRRTGAIPSPYLRYVYHPDREVAAQQAKGQVRAEELEKLERTALAEYVANRFDAAAARRPAPWYSEVVVPLLAALERKTELWTIANVTNERLLGFLPSTAAVEVAVNVRHGYVKPIDRDPLPPDARAILSAIAAYDVLVAPAILEGDRDGCVRALTAHPLVPSVDVAREIVRRVERKFGSPGTAA